MTKRFVIIYPERNDNYWENIKTLCTEKAISSSNDKFSKGIFINNKFYLYFYQTDGEVKKKDIEMAFETLGFDKQDEIIIFGHEYARGHPGISPQTLQSLQSGYSNLQYRTFTTGEPGGYPCKLLYTLNASVEQNELNFPTMQKKLNQSRIDFTWNTLEEEVKKKDLVKPLSLIKHRIGHIFLPVDIDLQGLVETNFDKKYLNEVLTAWKNSNSNPENKLDEARKLVYKSYESSSEQEKCLEEIKDEAKQTKKDEKEKEEIENIWEKLKAILPENEEESVEEKLKGLRELYNKAKEILECLNNRNAEKLKEIYKNGRNPFHEWFSKLCDILDELREAVGER